MHYEIDIHFIIIFFPFMIFKKLYKGHLFIVDKPDNINERRGIKAKPPEILSLNYFGMHHFEIILI